VAAVKRPNILLFVTDQQQARTICNQSPCNTPNINRLAAEGIRFDRAYATVALCCPSRAALISGQYPFHNGILNQVHVPERTRWDMEPGVMTYSQQLRDAGYHLGYVGKWHASWKRSPLHVGFHDLHAPSGCSEESLSDAPLTDDDDIASYRAKLGVTQYQANIERECTVIWPGGSPHLLYGINHNPEEAVPMAFETGHGVRLVEEYAQRDQPWFLTINIVEPHDPYLPHETYASRYDPAVMRLPDSFADSFTNKPYMNRRDASLWSSLTDEQVRTAIARYYAYCEQLDHQVGRIMDALKRTNQDEETLCIFTTDHGDMLGAHRQFIKGWQPYEETYRLPMVARWPGVIAPGQTCSHIVQLHDLAHTFVDVAGATPIEPADGRSLQPLFSNPDRADWDDVAFCQYYGGEFLYTQRMVITDRYKYVFNGFDTDEMYDLQTDPHEMHNAVDDPAYVSATAEMRTLLYDLMRRHNDPYASHHYGAERYLVRPT